MKKINYIIRLNILFVLTIGAFLLHGCTGTYVATNRVNDSPPAWAPAYEDQNEVNYYYLPDIEAYYDVRGRNYVYYNQGIWVYTASLPPAYASYDMNSAYVVVLDRSSREPWHQHTQYVSRYPRYYYRNEVREQGARPSRGFNENRRAPVYSRTTDDRREPNSSRSTEQYRRNTEPSSNRSSEQNSRNVTPVRSRSTSTPSRGYDTRNNSQPSNSPRTTAAPTQRNIQPTTTTPTTPATQTQRNTTISPQQQPQRTSTNAAPHNNPRQTSQPSARTSRQAKEDKKPASSEGSPRR